MPRSLARLSSGLSSGMAAKETTTAFRLPATVGGQVLLRMADGDDGAHGAQAHHARESFMSDPVTATPRASSSRATPDMAPPMPIMWTLPGSWLRPGRRGRRESDRSSGHLWCWKDWCNSEFRENPPDGDRSAAGRGGQHPAGDGVGGVAWPEDAVRSAMPAKRPASASRGTTVASTFAG